MNIALVLKVAGVGLIVCVVSMILTKAGREEQALLVSISAVVVVLAILIREIGTVLNEIRTVFGL